MFPVFLEFCFDSKSSIYTEGKLITHIVIICNQAFRLPTYFISFLSFKENSY